ncbi:MAG TPA: hypothetical protein VHZ29_05765 [Rhizomicrobium sp.]|jgi:hypothetical protein|nr:hypothetical protein [Rhizomicrobium sp.]
MPVAPATLLSDATTAEGGTLERNADIYIRPYPFPYVAGFALSNDCDSCGMEAFEDWHAFVNGRASTPYGEGLGLEIGDSFWVWQGGSLGVALSTGGSDEPVQEPAYAERLAEIGRAGWLDTLHSLGNWRQDYKSFRHDLGTREQVKRSLEVIEAKGLRPFVYVNHSFSPSNVSGPWGFYQKMDDPTHPMYAMDLIRKFGFRYFWPDYAQDVEKFGDHLAYESDAELRQAIKDYRQWKLIYKRTSPMESQLIDFPLELPELRALHLAMFNRTIIRVPALDGLPMAAFKRYRGPWTADETSFHLQASPENLDSLEERGGAVIVYQHFGVTRDGPDNTKRRSTPPVLSANSVGAWRDIARRADAGRLFVTTTGRLLDYLCLAERLTFAVKKSPDQWTIRLAPLGKSTEWSLRSKQELLNGLAFVVPAEAPEIVVLDSSRKKLKFTRAPDPVHPGRHAVYSQWQKLEWIPASLPAQRLESSQMALELRR